ncbi:MAG: protein kinase [Pseudomonadota bacterium]
MAKAQAQENAETKDNFVDELKPGTKLMHGQYTIENFLNAGGFGITYLARDSLDRKVVIKECFPGAFCRRSRYVVQARSRAHQNELKSIVRLFVQEARSLAKLDHPNIVGVHQVFEDNDTAYMALDFVEGRDLLDIIEDPNDSLMAAQVKTILKEILGAVGFIHDQGILHRDISPDNILINKDYHPVLIDFGAAREEATKQSRVLSALRVVKDGYSPQEFYIAGSEQSPSSDLYALAASFHHLIAGDVPPNSQARLAAIASGDADPYVPLAGRFSDYDDAFLGALDKALAVLPKDRVQSAKEWIEMMDAGDSNVTPLNAAAAAAVEQPGTQAASAQKSKMPLLLGSAAVVALLVGVGVFTMTSGGDDVAVADAPTTQAPVQEEVVAAAPAESAVEDAPAAVVEEPVAEASTAAPETQTVEAEEPALPPAAPAETAEASAAIAEESVAEAQSDELVDTIEETVASVVPEVLPEPAAEPEIVEEPASVINENAAVVEAPATVDTPTPVLRPAARPESVELSALPEPEPTPVPVETPTVAASDPVDSTDLPDTFAALPATDTQIPSVAIPAVPDAVSSVGAGPTVDIAAVTPGNEIVVEPEVTETGAISTWSVQLPFTAAGDQSNIIAAAGPIAPVWVAPGVVVTAVNGTEIDAIADIPGVLRREINEDEISVTIPVTFDILTPSTGETATEAWVLPVTQEVALTDGTRFQTIFGGSSWRTSVAALPEGAETGLQVGDVLTSYIPTGENVDGRDTLINILDREVAQGTTQYMFAVQRDGSLWVASLVYEGGVE